MSVICSNESHEFIIVCDEDVCGSCQEQELMRGPVIYAPKHASIPIVHVDTVHMTNYRHNMDKLREREAK